MSSPRCSTEQLQELPLLGRLVVPLVRHAHLRVLIGAGRAAHPDVHLMLRDEADGDLLPAAPGGVGNLMAGADVRCSPSTATRNSRNSSFGGRCATHRPQSSIATRSSRAMSRDWLLVTSSEVTGSIILRVGTKSRSGPAAIPISLTATEYA